jgi:hypothetical protein
MDPRHPDCAATRPFALVSLAAAATLSCTPACTPGAEPGDTERASTRDVEISAQSKVHVANTDADNADLNKYIDFHHCCASVPDPENARSLALPQGMAVTRNGATLHVVALGSDEVGVFATAQLDPNSTP